MKKRIELRTQMPGTQSEPGHPEQSLVECFPEHPRRGRGDAQLAFPGNKLAIATHPSPKAVALLGHQVCLRCDDVQHGLHRVFNHPIIALYLPCPPEEAIWRNPASQVPRA